MTIRDRLNKRQRLGVSAAELEIIEYLLDEPGSSLQSMANDMGLSKKGIDKACIRLHDGGYLLKEGGKLSVSTEAAAALNGDTYIQVRTKQPKPPKAKKEVIKVAANELPPPPPKKPKTINIPFDDWWAAYQKKVDKVACERAWASLSDAERETAMSHTAAYVLSTPDKAFRKNPKTYLNNKSFNNEIVRPKSRSSYGLSEVTKPANASDAQSLVIRVDQLADIEL